MGIKITTTSSGPGYHMGRIKTDNYSYYYVNYNDEKTSYKLVCPTHKDAIFGWDGKQPLDNNQSFKNAAKLCHKEKS